MPQDIAGNSLTTAREIQFLSGNQLRSFSDRVDSSDLNDYYKFRVQGHSSFGLKLTNSGGNADVELLNANGNRLQGSVNEGSTSELINTKIEAGTYYVRVYQGNGSGSDYSLDFSTQTNVQADLLWRNSVSGQDVIWQMNGAAIASGIEITAVKDLSWNIVASGDFNNDGQSDVVWRNSVSGANVIWYMNGATIASGVEIAAVKDLSWNIVASGDFNNDGQSDLVWRNSVSGTNVVWYMNGATIVSGVEITTVKELSWDLVAAADFNNDGQSDLVWRNSVSGANVIWYMNGATIASSIEITPVKDLTWKLVGAGDFDRDGQSDLVWRNSVGGANVIWYMNGAIIRSGVEITAVKELSWKIAAVAQRFEATAAIDWVGNTTASAFNLGTLSGNNSFTESIGGGDAIDYYQFSVSNPSVVNFKLSTPNLLYDILDSAGNVVAVKDSTFITPQFRAILEAGTYYVRIRDKGSSENYTLSIDARDNVIQKYDFSYVYNGGFNISAGAQDYYTGYFYDYAEKYEFDRFIDVNPRLNETGNNGRYLIGKSITSGTKSDLGKVYVNRYYDNETGMNFTPNGFLLNRASGTSYLGSELDYINASSGQNNDFGQDAWEYDAKPELVAASFDVIQNNAKPGNAIAVQFSVTNKSQAFAAASNVSFYLSTDRTITTTDRLLGTVSIPSLNGQFTSNLFSTNLSLPGFGDGIWYAGGTYYIGMIVDSGNTIAESNEVNNSNQGVGIDLDSLAISLPSIVKIIASDPSAAEQGVDPGFFTISRTGDISQALVVSLGIGGTAIAGTDYTSGGSTFGALTSVTFAAGQSSTLYVINPKDDALEEGNETVNVVLLASALGNYEIDASNNNATVIILDNDSTVSLTVTDAIATERKTTEVQDPGQFRITRSGDLTSALTVNYSISGSATNGIDYSQLSGRISFVAEQSSVLIPINILDDAIAESRESLTLTITSGAGYTIGSINSGTVTIADNDPILSSDLIIQNQTAPISVIVGDQISISSLTRNNGTAIAGTSAVRYWLSNDAYLDASDISLGSNAVGSLAVGSSESDSFSFSYSTSWGTGTKYILFQADGTNTVVESNESNNVAAAILMVSNPTISIVANDPNAAETNTGEALNPGQFTLTRTGNTAAALTVNYAISGTATNGTDYTPLSNSVTFASGYSQALINVNPINDSLLESSETVILTLQSGTSYQLGSTTSAAVTIANNDTLVIPNVYKTFDANQVFSLNSNPGANHTIYLDFDGHTTQGTLWNTPERNTITTPSYDIDGNSSSFSIQELQNIWQIWQRVAEDFIPFNINVTTALPSLDKLIKSSSTDTQWGIRVAIGGSSSDWYSPSAGGVAYHDSFNLDSDTPAFVFSKNLVNGNPQAVADAISHEVGHSLGLRHDGQASREYYNGQESDSTWWIPLMGASDWLRNQQLTQWSNGQYSGATNKEDDLSIITSQNGFGYRVDDYANNRAAASVLPVRSGRIETYGIIETRNDVDWFSFTTSGAINLTIDPFVIGPNLDILANLYNSSGILISVSNPTGALSASFNLTLSPGTYFLGIDGTGKGDPLTTGYDDYGSLGYYSIRGTIA
jgi:hypothetical protein